MSLSEKLVGDLYPTAPKPHVRAFARRNGQLLARFGIDRSANRQDFFLAQIGHESGGLSIVSENMNYSAARLREVWPARFPDQASAQRLARKPELIANTVYANRMGNGDPASGDGWRYRGRGYIQITGRDGYEKVGRIAGLDFAGQPDLVAEPEHALLAACAFWEWKALNGICDGGNFVSVTRRINGGTNGLADRRAWLEKVRRILAAESNVRPVPATFDIVAIQRALQDRGYPEVGAADGLVGPKTIAAIIRFRREAGLPDGLPDRLIDKALVTALGLDA